MNLKKTDEEEQGEDREEPREASLIDTSVEIMPTIQEAASEDTETTPKEAASAPPLVDVLVEVPKEEPKIEEDKEIPDEEFDPRAGEKQKDVGEETPMEVVEESPKEEAKKVEEPPKIAETTGEEKKEDEPTGGSREEPPPLPPASEGAEGLLEVDPFADPLGPLAISSEAKEEGKTEDSEENKEGKGGGGGGESLIDISFE